MIYIANNINYLSAEGLPWILCAWLGLVFFNSFATFFHELGHILSALILTKDEVMLRVGREIKSRSKLGKIGRVHWQLSFFNGREGFSGYARDGLSKLKLIIIISSGPLASFSLAVGTVWVIFAFMFPTWIEVILVSWFCANALAFFRSALPFNLKPTAAFPKGPPSDGLELMRIVCNKEK